MVLRSDGSVLGTGTLISPLHVLTAARVVNDFNNTSAAAGNLQFRPHGRTDAPAIVTRRIQGIGTGDAGAHADFAILKLDRSYTDIVPMRPTTTLGMRLPQAVDDAGYSGDLSTDGKTLGLHDNCQIVSWVGEAQGYRHDCDVMPGAWGGPLFTGGTTPSLIWGVNSLGGDQPGVAHSPNSLASGAYFAFAPANAGAVGVSYFSDGRLVAYAVDQDFARFSSRIADSTASSGWQPWYWVDDGFANGRTIAATMMQDGRQMLAVTNSANAVFLKRQQIVDGPWSATELMSPAPPVPALRVAATGTLGNKTQLFIQGADTIYASAKLGDADSDWDAWCDISGAVSELSSFAAVSVGSNQYVVWSGPLGTQARWTDTPGCSWSPTETINSGNYSALGLGLAADGRLHLMLGSASDRGLSHQYLDRSRNTWSSVQEFPHQALMDLVSCRTDPQFPTCPPYYTGLRSFGSGTREGREVLFAITSPNGEMFTTRELSDGTFETWTRFYK